MDLHKRAVTAIGCLAYLVFGERPAEQPFGILGAHVDTTMAHGHAEVLMPVGSVKSMALSGEEGSPGDAGELIIVCIGKQIAIPHVFGRVLFQNTEIALRRLCRKTV